MDPLLYAMLAIGVLAGLLAGSRLGRERARRASGTLLDATIYALIFLVGVRSAGTLRDLAEAGDPKPLVDVLTLTLLPMAASLAAGLALGVVLGWTRGGARLG